MQTKTMLAIIAIATTLLCTLQTYASLEISLNKASGFYEQAFQLNISTNGTSSIYYTSDGSDPATSTGRILYNPSGSISINQTTIIRVLAMDNSDTVRKTGSFIFLDQVLQQNDMDVIDDLNYPPVWGTGITNSIDPNSPPDSLQFLTITQDADYAMDQTVVQNPAYSNHLIDGFKQIPTLSIATDKENLFDLNTGIHVNTLEDWTVPASVEMINTDGTTAFCIEAGLSIAGAESRKYDFYKHSFKLSFNKSPHSKFVHVFLNGLYWGMFDLCEIPDADFMASYQNSNAQDYDAINHLGIVDGDSIEYVQLYHRARDVESDTVYTTWGYNLVPKQESLNEMYNDIRTKLDINAFIDYFLLNTLLVNTDWGANNWYATKKKGTGGVWQFFPWDAEFVLNNAPVYTSRVFYGLDPYHPTELDKLLRPVEEYQRTFGDRVQCHCFEEDGVLYTDNLLSTYIELENSIDKASLLELARWGDVRGTLIDYNTHIVNETTKYSNVTIPDLFEGDKGLLFYLQYGDDNYYPLGIYAPEFSCLGGNVQPGYQLSLVNPNMDGDIYYTLDGSDPADPSNSASQIYTGPITINNNVKVSARVFVETYTYGIANQDTIFNHWSAMCPRDFFTGQEDTYVSIEEVMIQEGLDNVCINMYAGINPQDFILEFSDPVNAMNGEVELQIFDFGGNALINTRLDLDIQNFYTISLNSGIYLYSLSVNQTEVFSGKIVKN